MADLVERLADVLAKIEARGPVIDGVATINAYSMAETILDSDWWFEARPYPRLTERYNAAKEANLGAQLNAEELTERVRVELQNAFAAGALWQYHRGDPIRGNAHAGD